MTPADLVKQFEGCRLHAYRDTRGVLTIGWGHTGDVTAGSLITQRQADEFLAKDLENAERAVDSLAPGATPGQRAALVSFTFNCGIAALTRSTLLKKFLAGDFQAAGDEFLKWRFADGKPVLLKRRQAEREVFLADSP